MKHDMNDLDAQFNPWAENPVNYVDSLAAALAVRDFHDLCAAGGDDLETLILRATNSVATGSLPWLLKREAA